MQLSHYLMILSILWLHCHNLNINWKVNTLIFNSSFCWKNCQTSLWLLWIYALFKLFKRDKSEDFIQLNIYFVLLQVCSAYVHCDYKMFIIYIEDIEETLNKKDKFNSKNIIFKEYHEFLDVFLLKKKLKSCHCTVTMIIRSFWRKKKSCSLSHYTLCFTMNS